VIGGPLPGGSTGSSPADVPATTCHYRPPVEEPEPIVARDTLYNFAALAVAGVLLSAWMLHFTDWFEEALTLLALGGLASWLAFMLKVVPEPYLKSFQSQFYDRILSRRHLWWILLVITALGLLFFVLFVASIEITVAEGDGDAAVWVYSPKCATPGDDALRWVAKGKSQRFVFFTKPLRPRKVVVKVSGYPEKVVPLVSFSRTDLRTPESFRRPVVLLRPVMKTVELVGENEVDAVIRVNGVEYPTKMGARSIWVGCDQDVKVPQELIQLWVLETEAEFRDWVHYGWARPRSLGPSADGTPPPRELRPGDSIQFLVKFPGRDRATTQSISVDPSARFPQVETIKENP